MAPISITDPDDPRIAAYRDVRERDLVGREGRFVAEGKVVLNVLFAARRFEVESVLILDRRLPGMAGTLAAKPADVPLYVADQATMDAIAGFHIHRGILAIGRKPARQAPDAMLAALPRDALVVALVGIANHDNVGAIFRNAAALGADAVLLDAASCDPLYRKAIRVSVGAALKVPYAVLPDAGAMFDQLVAAGFAQLAMTPRNAEDLANVVPGGRQAIYLGAEGPGLPDDLMARMRRVRIDMEADFDSLNVAAASAIALHRLRRLGRN
ncbi:RNA methyltransferase [Mesorhizobium sp. YIM 152430]|uniref:TrmH family RNA methyltransferase n=1 Tax=Mesorhizobium sp. YIM 152430 TaxID=3031761 RepID=UPI0023D982ED|nr:RNA methyltransferase [Mesorhizobium sp. YIM 152430]MDF1598632.1 RNA methyltransferase [Mesorhizobium sp. YIM 152430]